MHRFAFCLVLFFFVCANVVARPTFRKSIYDDGGGPDAPFSARFSGPVLNSDASDLHFEHMSTRSVGVDTDGNDLVVNLNYAGDLSKDSPIVKLDNILSIDDVSCFDLSSDGFDDLELHLRFVDQESALESAPLLPAGALVIAGHEWGCAHQKGNIVLMKLSVDAATFHSNAELPPPVLSLRGSHVEYSDFFENLQLEFRTNTYGTRPFVESGARATTMGGSNKRHLDAQACPMFQSMTWNDTPDGIFGFLFNVLDQVQDLISGVQALISGLATLADSLANDWEGSGLTYSRTLGFNWNAETEGALCELPLVYDPQNDSLPILSCTNCYGYISATLSMGVDIQGFQLRSANISLSGESEVNVQMDLVKGTNLEGSWSEVFFDEVPISAPISFPVGGVPIFIQPFLTMAVGAAVEMDAPAAISASVNQRNSAEFGIVYADGSPTVVRDFSVGEPTSNFDLDAELNLHMAADIETLLLVSVNYLGGPTASLKPFAEAEVQAVVDSSEYCAREFDASLMADLKIGLNAALGGELGPKFLDRPIEFSVVDQLLDYKPVVAGCVTGKGDLVGNPLLHDSSWVGTMTSCALPGEEVPIEVILRDMQDGQSQLEVIFNNPCTHVGRFQGDPINKVDQRNVDISPESSSLLQEGSEVECATTFSTYDHLASPTVQVPISAEAVLRDMRLTFLDGNMRLEGASPDGCNVWTAEYGREFILYDRAADGGDDGGSAGELVGGVLGGLAGAAILALCCCCSLALGAGAVVGLAVVATRGGTKLKVMMGGSKDAEQGAAGDISPSFVTATTMASSVAADHPSVASMGQASTFTAGVGGYSAPHRFAVARPMAKANTIS